MIIEDEENIVKSLKEKINRFGYEVIGAVCIGEEAIEFIEYIKMDLILIDIVLKMGNDGVEIAKDIRKISNIPIIFITGCCKEDFIDRIKNIVHAGYLLKPFRKKELYKAIKSMLNK